MELDFLNIQSAAIVAKANSGEVVILDDDISANEGGIAGGTLGAAMAAFGLVQLGALTLPGVGPIIALGTGLLAGGLVGNFAGRIAASLMDADYKDHRVKILASELQAGHPALVLEITNGLEVLPLLRKELEPYRAEVVEELHEARYVVHRAAKR
jgi:uncharacterized membrane protein